jgi:hypothetical protein
MSEVKCHVYLDIVMLFSNDLVRYAHKINMCVIVLSLLYRHIYYDTSLPMY